MAEENPFDLEGREAGPARPPIARDWTPEEQAEKLSGYLEVPAEFWEHVRYGTHVRYITKDGKFRTGGFVLKNPFDVKPNGEVAEKRFFKLQNGFSNKTQGYKQWLAAYESVAKVYMKPDAGVLVMMSTIEVAVKGLNENIRKLAEHARRLESRLATLEGKK